MKTTAVLFDAGEVLYHRPRRKQQLAAFHTSVGGREHLDNEAQERAQQLKTASWLGDISPDDYHRGMLRLHGVTDPADLDAGARVWEAVWPDVELFAGVPDTLRALADRGLRLGVVTNTLNRTQEKLAWFRDRGLRDDLWAAFATSCELALVKPHAGIYRHALDQMGCLPEEALFVGHAQHEIDGAKALGLATVAFNRDDETVTADRVIAEFTELLDLVGDAEGVTTVVQAGASGP